MLLIRMYVASVLKWYGEKPLYEILLAVEPLENS